MRKKATCTVEFEFNWTDKDMKNPLANEYHYAELYLASALGCCGYKGMREAEVNCIKMEDGK